MANFFRNDGWVKSPLGQALAGAQVYVCNQPANTTWVPPSPLVSIFSDPSGLVPITQPIISDGFGHYSFYAAPGLYTVIVVTGGRIQQVYPDQSLGGVGTNGTIGLVAGSGITIVADNLGNTTISTLGAIVPAFTNVAVQFLSSTGVWAVPSGTGIGISSVGLTMPSVFAVANSPLVTNGTLGVTFATGQANNQVLASPNGASGAVGLRALVAADIPALAYLPSGTQLAVTKAAVTSYWLSSYSSVTGAFGTAQPTFSDLSAHPTTLSGYGITDALPSSTQLAVTKAAVTSNFLTSYTSTSGAFTAAQPTFSDLSAHPTTLSGYGITDATASPRVASFNFVIDGGGSVPGTGVYGQISVPVACTITGWVLTGDASGSAVVDVLACTYANFPTTASICSGGAGDKPTLSTVQKNENLSVSGSVWTTALTAGEQIQANLNSVTTCKRLNLTILVTIP